MTRISTVGASLFGFLSLARSNITHNATYVTLMYFKLHVTQIIRLSSQPHFVCKVLTTL